MKSEVLLRDLNDGVLTLMFNRPERNNGWTMELEEAYFDAITDAAAAAEVRVVLVTGAGRSFCPGLDMQALSAASEGRRFGSQPRRPMTYALSLPKPLIAVINGACAGIGFIQASCADVRFVAPGAKLTTAFARRGLPAENSISWLLPRLIGHARAADLLISARTFLADEALHIGFVKQIVDSDELMATAMAYANDLAKNVSPISMATIKAQLWGDWNRTQDGSRRNALAKVAELSDGYPDFHEGVESYVQKRPPNFPGLSIAIDVDREFTR